MYIISIKVYFMLSFLFVERVHNAVEIDIFGLHIHGHQFVTPTPPPPPRKNYSGVKNYLGANDVISNDHVLCF